MTVIGSDVVFTAHRVTDVNPAGARRPLAINIRITNRSKVPLVVTPQSFTLIHRSGKETPISSIVVGDDADRNKRLAPGQQAQLVVSVAAAGLTNEMVLRYSPTAAQPLDIRLATEVLALDSR